MDGWIALGILALLAVPVMAVVAFFMVIGARRRIVILEQKIAALEQRGILPATAPIIVPEVPAAGAESPAIVVAEPSLPPSEPEAPAEAFPAEAPDATPPAGPAAPEEAEAPPAPVTPARPKRPRESLEQKLGARWAVWVGGLALALGAIFLVRYSIDAGLIGPGVRIAASALFSLALIAAGEWLRRSNRVTAFSAIPSANIPGILTAAGTVGLFATAYGAYALYALIGPTTAFILLAAIGLGTMAAAALHGPWLSGLGLVGAYVAPLLVATDNPNVPMLMVYLTFVTSSAFGLARLRLWRWLAIAAGVAAIGWGFAMLASSSGPFANGAYAIVLLCLVLVFLVVDVHRGRDPAERSDKLAVGLLWAIAVLLLTGTGVADFDNVSLGASLLGVAMLLAASWRYDAVALAAPGAAGLLVTLLYFWPASQQVRAEATTYIADAATAYFRLPDTIGWFAAVAIAGAAALIGTALSRLRVPPAPRAFTIVTQAAAATAGPLLTVTVAYLRIAGFVSNIGFAAIALALAGLYALLTERFVRAERDGVASDTIPTGLFAAASIAGIALSLTMALEGGMLTTAFALASLGAAWVQLRRPIATLRYSVTVLAVLVLARIAWDPYIFGTRSGAGVYLSILLGYGIPAAAFALASILLRRVREDRAVYFAEALAVILAALLVVFEIRAIVFGGDLLRPATALAEQGLTTAAAFAFSLGLARLAKSRPSPVFRLGGQIARIIGLANAAIALAFVVNPLVTGVPVAGGMIFNEIFLAYAVPAMLAALIAVQPIRQDDRIARWLRPATGLAALLLAFAAISLEIRFLFAGAVDLSAGPIGSAESYTYSAAWLVLGLALLLGGLLFDLKAARLASAALILVTVLKVFLIDMANLEGAWRALSFMGLGIVLIGIGLLYQRLLFGRPSTEPPRPEAEAES